MTKIHELLDRDPLQVGLANNGQARITQERDERTMRELRAELETFVCKGQFADALERILERYLTQLDASRQDAVWVSGFFGSGKSHLLKMLGHLWVNTEFEDRQTARGLVGDRLPQSVRHSLRELDTRARQIGADPMAAAGSLLGGNVGHVRLSVLAIVLRACGFPERYAQARFCFWLRDEGLIDTVRASVAAAGREWERELNNLYVSPVMAKAVMDVMPGLAADLRGARQLIARQFPQPRADISTEQFVESARDALAPGGGPIPPTVVVLDEVQQYINEAGDRAQIVTDLAEALQTELGSRVLVVASGQSALVDDKATPLGWLSDRFRVTVQLADAEVETVTREVLLRKKPAAEAAIREVLNENAGEVSRHLQGTRLAVQAEDKPLEVGDYPLLRTRRRFWEACFQATNPAGTRSQLRSQLRILHDSLRAIARRPLGAVIPASDLFHALAQDMVGASVLLNEIHTRIRKLDDGTDEGRLRADLCGVVFLIGKLPREQGADAGVRSDANTVADLMVDDLAGDTGVFRTRVARTLKALAGEGVLMMVEDEYRIQTREGAEWEQAFRQERSGLGEVEIASRREHLLNGAVQEEMRGVRPRHGRSKTKREVSPHFGAERPGADGGGANAGDAVWVWVRDGWSCPCTTVVADARRKGMEDSVLYVHLPRRSAEELRSHIASAEAARKVLAARGVPGSHEGQEARASIQSRRESAKAARDRIVEEIVGGARVFRGGGDEVYGEGLRARIAAGAESSLARLFPRFGDADHRGWEKAFTRIGEGTGTPFGAVGWMGAVAEHPVAKEVLRKVGAKGETGRKVRDVLAGAPYGWPREATYAALLGLLADGHLKAERNGLPVGARSLTKQTIQTARFVREKVRLTAKERLDLRQLFQRMKIRSRSGEVGAKAPEFLARCGELASSAGGSPPLPPGPDTRFLEELAGLAGNEQLAAIHEQRTQIEDALERWTMLRDRARDRERAWQLAKALHRHAEGDLVEVARDVGMQLGAIRDQRKLLDDTDHVGPCVTHLANALSAALAGLHDRLASVVEEAAARLAADATWQRLDTHDQSAILREVGLAPPRELQVGTNEALRAELRARGLAGWRSEIDAVRTRESRALAEATRRLPDDDPVTVNYIRIRRGTLENAAAVDDWLAEHRKKLVMLVREGPVIVE